MIGRAPSGPGLADVGVVLSFLPVLLGVVAIHVLVVGVPAAMRLVAQEAGVAVGNAYHHVASKDVLVQELYLETVGVAIRPGSAASPSPTRPRRPPA